MLRQPLDVVIRRVEMIKISVSRRDSGRPKMMLIEIINKYLNTLSLIKDMFLYGSQWQQSIYVADLNSCDFTALLLLYYNSFEYVSPIGQKRVILMKLEPLAG